MPLYEYQCTECQKQYELLVRGSEKPQCPDCEKDTLEKQLSVPAAPSSGGNKELPIAPQSCQMPRCCGGGCQM